MSILVFGKTGQVASELAGLAPDAIFLGRDGADLGDPAACAEAIRAQKPGVVINAAAYTAVDRAEEDEALASVINGDTPTAMAQACAALDIPFVHISTDYVFDGTGTAPWAPDDPVAPQNAYGRSKLMGEVGVRTSGAHAVILRTSWVFSAHGNNFVKTMLHLSETRDVLKVVADQIGGPTPARDIAQACLHITDVLLAGQGGGTYHFSGWPHVSWATFARAIFNGAGRRVRVEDIPTSAYPTRARRPLNSRLDCTRLATDFGITPPDWQAGLSKVLHELGVGT